MASEFEAISKVSHDLNKYLARIKAFNYLLYKQLNDHINPDQKYFFEGIEKSCESMSHFIQDLMATDKLSSQEVEYKERVSLNNLVKKMVLLNRTGLESKNIQIVVNVSATEFIMWVNPSNLERAINNLLHNAIKFTPVGGCIQIDLESCLCENYVTLVIADTGIGIPKEIGHKIFDKFTTAGRRGTQGEESNGLGMYITKTIVQQTGGKIWFESKENKGTRFFLKLPIDSMREMENV